MKKLKLLGRKRDTDAPADRPPDRTLEGTIAANIAEAPRRRRHARLAKIASPWRLFLATLKAFGADWKPYVKILALVTLPSDLLSLLSLFNGDPLTASYVSFAAIVMNVALLWAMVRKDETGQIPNVPTAYYDGSAALVRFILVSFTLVVMLIPVAFGAALYAISISAAQVVGVSGPEQILIGFAALLLTVPSFYLITRYALAPIAAVRDGLRPMAALRRSRLLVMGRFWAVAGRLVMLIVYLAIVSLPIALVTFLLSLAKAGQVATVFFEIATTLTALPIGNLYLIKLYRALEGSFETEKVEELEGITALEQSQEPAA